MSMIRTPHFALAATVAFVAMPYHRVAFVRIAGVWIVRVLP